jgi:hypothetical protein
MLWNWEGKEYLRSRSIAAHPMRHTSVNLRGRAPKTGQVHDAGQLSPATVTSHTKANEGNGHD